MSHKYTKEILQYYSTMYYDTKEILLYAPAHTYAHTRTHTRALQVTALLRAGPGVAKLQSPFTDVSDAAGVKRGSFLYRWLDYLAFALSGLPAAATQVCESTVRPRCTAQSHTTALFCYTDSKL
jgi:hypothetical protein